MTTNPETISPDAFRVAPADGERPGALVSFPYDRTLVRRFRASFPRARWREDHWVVPGVRACARAEAWAAREIADLDRHADAKGRDAYAFEPLESRFLEVGDELIVRTPYSRTIVGVLRGIPFARWDFDEKVWKVPFRSYAELRRRWPEIEAAALRREAGEKEPAKPKDAGTKRRMAEARRRRYPVPADDPPPANAPVATMAGVVVFEETGGELIDAEAGAAFPFAGSDPDRFVWATWRLPTFRELRALRPAGADPDAAARRGWWAPTVADVDARLDTLRRVARRAPATAAGKG